MTWEWKQEGGIMSTQGNKKASMLSTVTSGFCKYFKVRLVTIGVGVAICVIVFILMAAIPPRYTEITDIDQYGHYTGTGADSFTNNYIKSFFPVKIESIFTNVIYSYKAESTDTYGFEAYLEFTIADKTQFDEYIASIKTKDGWSASDFVPGFMEYNIENVLVLDEPDAGDDPTSIFYQQIIKAKIRKIMYSAEKQTVIYVALGVHDGGGIGTNYLNTFFDRFQIDPAKYEKAAQSTYNVDPYGIN